MLIAIACFIGVLGLFIGAYWFFVLRLEGEAEQRIAPMLLSFMSESRRLANTRMKRELRLQLRHPSAAAAVREIAPRALRKQLALPL